MVFKPKDLDELKMVLINYEGPNEEYGNIEDWDVSGLDSLEYLFEEVDENNDYINNANLNKWDVSNVTKMGVTFYGSYFNGDISQWNVSNVRDMTSMFAKSKFNGDISRWNTKNVISMEGMFLGSEFNGNISKWDTKNVAIMDEIFAESEFRGKGGISKWNVSKVESLGGIFRDSQFVGDLSNWIKKNPKIKSYFETRWNRSFNIVNGKFTPLYESELKIAVSRYANGDDHDLLGDISEWNVSNITSMRSLFFDIKSENIINANLSKWDTSKVTDMSFMFSNSSFNGDISAWDVSNVRDMSFMFSNSPFNGDISKWDVKKVENMSYMFQDSKFTGENGDLGNWKVESLQEYTWMFYNTELDEGMKHIVNWDEWLTADDIADITIRSNLEDYFEEFVNEEDEEDDFSEEEQEGEKKYQKIMKSIRINNLKKLKSDVKITEKLCKDILYILDESEYKVPDHLSTSEVGDKHFIIVNYNERDESKSEIICYTYDMLKSLLENWKMWFVECVGDFISGTKDKKMVFDKNKDVYVKIPISEHAYMGFVSLGDVKGMIEKFGEEDIFYILPKKEDGKNKIITHTSSYANAFGSYQEQDFVSAYHCQEGSSIQVYTIKVKGEKEEKKKFKLQWSMSRFFCDSDREEIESDEDEPEDLVIKGEVILEEDELPSLQFINEIYNRDGDKECIDIDVYDLETNEKVDFYDYVGEDDSEDELSYDYDKGVKIKPENVFENGIVNELSIGFAKIYNNIQDQIIEHDF